LGRKIYETLLRRFSNQSYWCQPSYNAREFPFWVACGISAEGQDEVNGYDWFRGLEEEYWWVETAVSKTAD